MDLKKGKANVASVYLPDEGMPKESEVAGEILPVP
jgi:hypothetical protein